MGSWRRFDINAKGVEGIQERTIGGGLVTLLSCLCVAFLLVSEFSVWWTVDVTHRMHVDTDPVRALALVCLLPCVLSTRRSCVYLLWHYAHMCCVRVCTCMGRQQDFPITAEVDISFLHEKCTGASTRSLACTVRPRAHACASINRAIGRRGD